MSVARECHGSVRRVAPESHGHRSDACGGVEQSQESHTYRGATATATPPERIRSETHGPTGERGEIAARLAMWLADVSAEAALTAVDCREAPDDPAIREPSSE
jgi:hypothetical protein